jgi:hypothetical protein
MGIVRHRRGSGGGGEGEKDAHLPFLSRVQADWIRALFRQAMAERGRETMIRGGHIEGDGPTYFGLWNVAVACHEDPRGERAWPRIVARHADVVAAAANANIDAELAACTPGELPGRVYAHIVPERAMGGSRPLPRYARELAPGLAEMFVLDQPKTVAYLGDSQVERLGGAAVVRAAALTSLRLLPPVTVHHAGQADAGHCDFILNESAYTADRLLVLPHMLAQLHGDATAPHGVLTCMPTRQMAMFHVIRDVTTLLPSLELMARMGYAKFGEGRHRLSPEVFWCREQSWQQLTFGGAGDKLTVRVEGEFADVLDALRGESLPRRGGRPASSGTAMPATPKMIKTRT